MDRSPQVLSGLLARGAPGRWLRRSRRGRLEPAEPAVFARAATTVVDAGAAALYWLSARAVLARLERHVSGR